MNRTRMWAEMMGLCATVAVTLALGLAAIGSSAAAWGEKSAATSGSPNASQEAAGQEISGATRISGVITDSLCKGKHDTAMNQSASACTKVCLKKGGKYVLVAGDNVYALDGGTAYLDKFAGERVTITGVLTGETMKVDSVQGGQR
jgi:hypothetical protein